MGLFDWLRKKPPADSLEQSSGGSKMIRHGEPKKGMPGMPQFSTLPYIKERERVYQEMFGPMAGVHDDAFPGLVPHIDVYVHPPGFAGRDFYTLVTGGMSDLPMKLPPEAAAKLPRRVELIFYLHPDDELSDEYVSVLRKSARFVYDYETWLYWGHTIPNGNPPQPIFAGSELVSLLFLLPLFEPDNALANYLILDGDPVSFLWLVPLTRTEHQYKLAHGTEALEDAFNNARLPFVFNRARAPRV